MNSCIFIGNLSKDCELTTTNNGISVCKFSIAVNRPFANASGEKEVDFINIVAWRGLADNCAKYLKKGSKAAVSGSLQIRNYEAPDGTKRYITEILAQNVEFLTSSQNSPNTDSDTKPSVPRQQKMSELTPIDDDSLPF